MDVITDEDRRHRIVNRHFGGGSAAEVVGANVCLHSTDPASVFLAVRGRQPDVTRHDIEHALYDERSVVRHIGMRRTLFVVPSVALADVHAACTVEVHRRERRRLVKILEEADLDTAEDADAWLADVEDRTVEAIDRVGPCVANALRDEVPELRRRVVVPRMKVDSGLTTFVLSRLGMSGRIVRGRPQGSWVSGKYHWHLASDWLGTSIDDRDPAGARSRLGKRWLAAFGPATVDDLQWWSGWNKTQTRAALRDAGTVEVETSAGVAHVVTGDEGADAADDLVRLLPALDGTAMGWKDRRFFLDDELRAGLFDRFGNIGPTVWHGGRVVGGWGQAPDGAVRWSVVDAAGSSVRDHVAAEASRLTEWLDGTVVSPRFPTPLQKELAAQPA